MKTISTLAGVLLALLLAGCVETGVRSVTDGIHTMKSFTIANGLEVTRGCGLVRNADPKGEIKGTACKTDLHPVAKLVGAAALGYGIYRGLSDIDTGADFAFPSVVPTDF